MNRVLSLYRSSIGRKSLVAGTGIILLSYVVMHMLGNLKAFQGIGESGRHALDDYAIALRETGYPILPEYGLVWVVRVVLLVAVIVHFVTIVQLWRQSRAARPTGYRKYDPQVFSYASRTMRWGGVIVLLFVIYHVLHLTTGQAHPDFEYGSVYANLVTGFQSVPVALFYILAVGALSLHIYHGIWSMFVTFGAQNPRIQRMRRPLAAVIAVSLFVGFVSVPLAVLLGRWTTIGLTL